MGTLDSERMENFIVASFETMGRGSMDAVAGAFWAFSVAKQTLHPFYLIGRISRILVSAVGEASGSPTLPE